MRVLTLNYEYPPLGGGAAPASEELATTLVDRGHEVDVVTMGFDGLPDLEIRRGVEIHRVTCLRTSSSMSRPHEMATFLPTGFLRARTLLQQRDYDVVHSHFILPTGTIALALKRRYDVPYVITPHGSDVPGYNPDRFGLLHRATMSMWRRIVEEAETIVSPSNYLAGLIRSAGADTPIEVVPYGFDHVPYDPDRDRNERILITSRLFERKGIQFVLEALAEIDTDWDVVIAGDGPYRTPLERKAKRLELDVTFTGWLDRNTALKSLLETSEVYVFPSSHDNCPVSLLEAMAAGTAVVASKHSGTGEVVGDAGLVVDPQNVTAVASAIERVQLDSTLRSNLQKMSRKRIEERYDWDRIGERYENLFEVASAQGRGTTSIDERIEGVE